MPRLVAPLTDMRVKNAKRKEKPYKLADGGLYLEITPAGSKLWRMKFVQATGKESRLSFGAYAKCKRFVPSCGLKKGAYIDHLSLPPGEQEMLRPPGLKYRVSGKSTQAVACREYRVIDLEIDSGS